MYTPEVSISRCNMDTFWVDIYWHIDNLTIHGPSVKKHYIGHEGLFP